MQICANKADQLIHWPQLDNSPTDNLYSKYMHIELVKSSVCSLATHQLKERIFAWETHMPICYEIPLAGESLNCGLQIVEFCIYIFADTGSPLEGKSSNRGPADCWVLYIHICYKIPLAGEFIFAMKFPQQLRQECGQELSNCGPSFICTYLLQVPPLAD
jgi:hypothetical protein